VDELDETKVAMLMLEWQRLQSTAKEIEDRITQWGLDYGKTYTVGKVRLSYSKGSGGWDYQKACEDHGGTHERLREEGFVKISYDYKGYIDQHKIDKDPYRYETSGPSVSLQLLK